MKEILHYLLENIIGSDQEIRIEETQDGDSITFNVYVPEEQRGVVIGKRGMNIKAIRDLISIIARRENKKAFIKITD